MTTCLITYIQHKLHSLSKNGFTHRRILSSNLLEAAPEAPSLSAWLGQRTSLTGCLLESQGEVWNPTRNWLELNQGEAVCVERCFLWHGIQHPRGSLPHCELGQEQRPWGTGSPDMRGSPPTSSLGLRLLPWTKPAKESSLTEARAQQQCRGLGRNVANCSEGRRT